MRMRKTILLVAALFLIHAGASDVIAWSTRPEATELNEMIRSFRSVRFWSFWGNEVTDYLVAKFTLPVHEAITNCIYGCSYQCREHNFQDCASPTQRNQYAPSAVLAGARWNDNPPFVLTGTKVSDQQNCVGVTIQLPANHPECWAILYYDAQKGAIKKNLFYDGESGHALLYRVHFGDMQFLHSMATRDGETADETKKKIMAWAEFAYKVSLGEIKHSASLNQCGVDGVEALFKKKTGWTVQMLFTWDDPTYKPYKDQNGFHDKAFRDFAFGSLLHMVQDSFSAAHAAREPQGGLSCGTLPDYENPGRIMSFHSFTRQEYKKHSAEDKDLAFREHIARNEQTQSSIADVGRVLRAYYEQNRPWDEIKIYLDCVYDLADPNAPAGPGDGFSEKAGLF